MPRQSRIAEKWKCSKCGAEYHSPIRIQGCTCSTPRCNGTMRKTSWVPPELTVAQP